MPQLPPPAGFSSGPFVKEVCVPFLLTAQNHDGGWGHRSGARSSVEPTSWVLLALSSLPQKKDDFAQAITAGQKWLLQTQLPDGSWPASVGQAEGSWVTALACLALQTQKETQEAVTRGATWLCNSWPGEGGPWWRLRHRLYRNSATAGHKQGLRGWSWTVGTSSWVEPTSAALILLRNIPETARPQRAARRIQLAEAMLYDRMCPGGGWNCGNPAVYGDREDPQIIPTVWALLALQDHRDRSENQVSLAWLEGAYRDAKGPASLALAHLCLEVYRQSNPSPEPALQSSYSASHFLGSTLVMAWVTAAMSAERPWLRQAHP